MEDDHDQRDGQDGAGATPESLLPYDQWMEDALRHVVARALTHAATEGLPGRHHYYITFRTDFPGVVIPARLREKYPEEMTIVLQHQYEHLIVDEASRSFGVSLSFGGVLSALTVPFDAVSAFVDPHVQYGLRFRVAAPAVTRPSLVPALKAPAEAPTAADTARPGEDDGAELDATPQVVSLDAFRRRKD